MLIQQLRQRCIRLAARARQALTNIWAEDWRPTWTYWYWTAPLPATRASRSRQWNTSGRSIRITIMKSCMSGSRSADLRRTSRGNGTWYHYVDDDEMAVKVNAVIYIGRDRTKQMSDRKMEDLWGLYDSFRRYRKEGEHVYCVAVFNHIPGQWLLTNRIPGHRYTSPNMNRHPGTIKKGRE